MSLIDINKTIEKFETIKGKREAVETNWKKIEEYVCIGKTVEKNDTEVFDSTARWARHQLASALQSLLINPQTMWFSIALTDDPSTQKENLERPFKELEPENDENRLYCYHAENTLRELFSSAHTNFYGQIHEFFLNLVSYGTAIFYLQESPLVKHGCYFKNIDVKECFFNDNDIGTVDEIFRLFELTFAQATFHFPKEQFFIQNAERDPNGKTWILHVCQPSSSSQNNKNVKKYDSVYISMEKRTLLVENTLDYFPFMVTRWTKQADSAYGFSPAMQVMPEITLLNGIRKGMIIGMHRHLDPPILMPKEGYQLPVHNLPGSINFYRNGIQDKIQPLLFNTEHDLPVYSQIDHCKEAILKAFHLDLFHMPKEDKEMTASEALIRNEEQMRRFGAIIGRIETELLNPMIINVYHILNKYGHIQSITQDGSQANITIEYRSPLAKAQKASLYSSVEDMLGFIQRSGIANIKPEIYHNINFDRLFKLFVELKNVPPIILATQAEFQQERGAFEQQKQAMIQQQMMGGK